VFNLDGTFLTGTSFPSILLSNASPTSSTTNTNFPTRYLGVKFTFTYDVENQIITVSATGQTPVISSSPVAGSLSSQTTVNIITTTTTFYAAASAQSSPFITAPLTTPSCTKGLLQYYPTYPNLPTTQGGFKMVDQSFTCQYPLSVDYSSMNFKATFVPVSVSESSYTNSTLQSLIFSAVDVNAGGGVQAVQSLAVVLNNPSSTSPQLIFNSYNQYPANTHWLFKVSQNAANAANQSNADKNNPYFVWVIGQSTNPSTYFFVTHTGTTSLTLQKIANISPGAGTRQVIEIIQQYLFTNAPKPTAADPSLFTKWSLLWKFRDDDHLIDGSNASGNEILIVTADDTYYVTYPSATTNSVLGLTAGKGPSSPSSTNPGLPGIPGTIKGSSPPYKTTTNTSRLYCYYTFAGDTDNPVKEYADSVIVSGSTVVETNMTSLYAFMQGRTWTATFNTGNYTLTITRSSPTSTMAYKDTLTMVNTTLQRTATFTVTDISSGNFTLSDLARIPVTLTAPIAAFSTSVNQTYTGPNTITLQSAAYTDPSGNSVQDSWTFSGA
jgi:hypothetical protein